MSSLASWLQGYANPAPEGHWTTKLWQGAWNAQENVLSLYQVREESVEQQQGQGDHEDEEDEDEDEDDWREPTQCVVMQGIEGKFEGHNVSAVLMRSEYVNLMQALIDFVKGTPRPEDEALENGPLSYLKSISANPFASYNVKKDRAIMIISGSPGSGKSLFLYPLLGLRLNARLPTAFQVGEGPVYLFTELGCHVVGSLGSVRDGNGLAPHVPGIWCLTDSTMPPLLYQSTLGTVVYVASSPRPNVSFGWLTMMRLLISASRVSMPPVRLFFMPTFGCREAKLARDLQISGPKPTDEQLETWFWTFTPNLRVAFANAHDQANYQAGLMARVPFDTERGMVDVIRRVNQFEDIGDPHNEFFCWQVQGREYKADGNFVSRRMPELMVEYLGATTPDAQMAMLARLFEALY